MVWIARFDDAKRAANALAFAALLAAAAPAVAHASERCAPKVGDRHEVVRVVDGDTLVIDDGREVRLMGALAPKGDPAAGAGPDWPPAREAARALEALVAGQTIALRYEGRRQDRYGRVLAQVYVEEGGEPVWVQRRLVDSGQARAYALPGNSACLDELMVAEAAARHAESGIWARETFRVRNASEVAALLRLTGRFAIVEGRVAKVARTKATTYINFDTDWRRDFTASLATAIVDKSDGGAERASALEGKEIRVRGWIERRNGPMIVLGSLGEIEVIEKAAAGDTPQR